MRRTALPAGLAQTGSADQRGDGRDRRPERQCYPGNPSADSRSGGRRSSRRVRRTGTADGPHRRTAIRLSLVGSGDDGRRQQRQHGRSARRAQDQHCQDHHRRAGQRSGARSTGHGVQHLHLQRRELRDQPAAAGQVLCPPDHAGRQRDRCQRGRCRLPRARPGSALTGNKDQVRWRRLALHGRRQRRQHLAGADAPVAQRASHTSVDCPLGRLRLAGSQATGRHRRGAHLPGAGGRRLAIERHRALHDDLAAQRRPVHLCRPRPTGQRRGYGSGSAQPHGRRGALERLRQQCVYLSLGPAGTVGIRMVPGRR